MTRRSVLNLVFVLTVLTSLVLSIAPVLAGGTEARVRVAHASPDAPAVDVWVDGQPAFNNVAFKAVTDYANVPAGDHKVLVVPAGQTEPAVISATLSLTAGQDYTVVAAGKLAEIKPIVLEDNNAAPAAGKAHVRFVHASPDAPAVDIAVKGGPTVFTNIAFGAASVYTPVEAGTYDLQALPTGTSTVALDVPGVALADGGVYTIFAEGLVGGEPNADRCRDPRPCPGHGPGHPADHGRRLEHGDLRRSARRGAAGRWLRPQPDGRRQGPQVRAELVESFSRSCVGEESDRPRAPAPVVDLAFKARVRRGPNATSRAAGRRRAQHPRGRRARIG